MKNFLLKLDAVLLVILALPGIIVGLPYLISENRKNNDLIEQYKKELEEIVNASDKQASKKRKKQQS